VKWLGVKKWNIKEKKTRKRIAKTSTKFKEKNFIFLSKEKFFLKKNAINKSSIKSKTTKEFKLSKPIPFSAKPLKISRIRKKAIESESFSVKGVLEKTKKEKTNNARTIISTPATKFIEGFGWNSMDFSAVMPP
jgi:hypothetical protein